MALPPELQQEMKKVADLEGAQELALALEDQVRLADDKARAQPVKILASNALIAGANLAEAEQLATAYTTSLNLLGLVEETKVHRLDWRTVFDGSVVVGPFLAAKANLERAFKNAEGGVLLIVAPNQCPPDMSPLEFSRCNFDAIKQIWSKIDEPEKTFTAAVDQMLDTGRTINDIDHCMSGCFFENPRKPVVVMAGTADDMRSMVFEASFAWNKYFRHKLGFEQQLLTSTPAPKAPPAPPKAPPPPPSDPSG
jgi:hypothetical protein